jgi:hypothetical protein
VKRLALLLALATAAPLLPAAAPADLPRGPAEIRDGHLLAQPRLTLPAVAPWTIPAGAWSVQVSALWANSFSWTQDVAGEAPDDRHFLIDGEALVLDATFRRGLGRSCDVAVRVPFQSRGGGALDGFIDWWHRFAHVPDGNRPDFRKNAFRVEGRTTDGSSFSWNDSTGSGLGDVEMEGRWRVHDGGGDSASVALVGRVSLPTGTGPFAGNGLGGGGQLVLDAPLGRSVSLYAGLGTTAQDVGPVRGIEYAPLRVHGFLALEWRPWRRLSLVAETDAASRLVENIESYPGLHWIVNVTGRIDLGGRTRLDLGFTENLKSQLTTTDFALYLGLGLRP